MAGGRFELAMEPTAIRLVSLNSNLETHMTVICDVGLIYGRGWISRVFICCATLMLVYKKHILWFFFKESHLKGYFGIRKDNPSLLPFLFLSGDDGPLKLFAGQIMTSFHPRISESNV